MGDWNGGWVYLEHAETHGVTRVPDHPKVIEQHEALGWSVIPDPDEDAEPQEAKPKSRAAAKVKE